MSFWDIVWFIVIGFAFMAYLMVMFAIISDLFRDENTSGWAKAAWIVGLIFLPLLVSLIYIVTRGRAMTQRSAHDAEAMRQEQDAYIREVASKATSPTDQIAQAKAMLDAGLISQAEYDRLKEKALV
ncbi:MAG TPA: SHOCT domain-containing protein [Kribbella sp.]|nr:SHOCT domain-containing protein [Kribbella sp.]